MTSSSLARTVLVLDRCLWITLVVIVPCYTSLAGGGGAEDAEGGGGGGGGGGASFSEGGATFYSGAAAAAGGFAGSSASSSTTPTTTTTTSTVFPAAHLSPPTCPRSCSCRYGPHTTVESFYVSCAVPTNGSDNHSIPADASNITSLHLLAVRPPALRPLLPTFSGLRLLEWHSSGLQHVPLRRLLHCNKTLRTLDLAGNAVSDPFPSQAWRFGQLRALSLRANNVSQLLRRVDGGGGSTPWPQLEELDLSFNTLSYLSCTPSLRHALPALLKLNVSNNLIESVQGSGSLFDGLPGLQELDVSHNSLVALSGIAGSAAGSELVRLHASHNAIMSLSIGAFATMFRLEELDLSHNRLTIIPTGAFARDQHRLKNLYLSHNRILAFGPGALTGLYGLHTLRLDHNRLSQVEASYFSRAVPDTSPGWESDLEGHLVEPVTAGNSSASKVWLHLHTVDLSHNNISDIAPSIFHSTLALIRHIDLAFNRITCLPRYGVETLTELESINVSHNHLQWLDIGTFKNARLRTINLSHNHLVKLISMAFLYLPAVERVDLSYNQLDYIYKYAFYKTCAFDQRLTIDLRHNELVTDAVWKIVSSFRHLQGSACLVRLRMQDNAAMRYVLGGAAAESYHKHLMLGDYHYFRIWDHVEVDARLNAVVCDCAMYREVMLLEAVRTTFLHNLTHPEHLLFWRDLLCHSPPRLARRRVSDVLPYTECPLTKGCPAQCRCALQPIHGLIEVDCAGRNLTQFPVTLPAGRKTLHLGGNRLGVLRGDINLTDVIAIDLTANSLRYIDRQAWELLLAVPVLLLNDNALESLPWSDQNMSATLNITLSNNAFQCTCDNILFKDWLMEHFDKVYDALNISCANGRLRGLAMLDVDDADFECLPDDVSHSGLPVGLFVLVLGGALAVGIVLGFLTYRYRLYLKLFCVQRWPPWSSRFGDDPARKADIFVCYSFMDARWVNRQLLPRLLSHFPPYRVRLQHQETKPGALLSENLVDSLESSEITILVLSLNLLRHEWQSDECRFLLQQVLQDDLHNVYAVLLDDEVLEELEPEVTESVVRTQQCFSLQEDWFWERLFHMLPPPQCRHHKPPPTEEELMRPDEMQVCAKY